MNAAVTGTAVALVSPDGLYLDADPATLDLYGVTLDVLRQKRVGDFSPPELAPLERQLWALWVHSGLQSAEGGGTIIGPDGNTCRVWVGLERQAEGTIRLALRPIDEPVRQPPAIKVKEVLGQWRDLERHLAETAPDDPERARLQARIDALRDEYHRRTGGR
jgi:PAS domain-containing protein